MLSHFSITVAGKVQGVFFRASTQKKATGLGLSGFVRNQPDGTVYIEAEGDPERLNDLVKWCEAGGPMGARVSSVMVSAGELQSYSGFTIQP